MRLHLFVSSTVTRLGYNILYMDNSNISLVNHKMVELEREQKERICQECNAEDWSMIRHDITQDFGVTLESGGYKRHPYLSLFQCNNCKRVICVESVDFKKYGNKLKYI